MNQPLVSVIIPNYNYGRFLGAAIDGVLAQTYPNVEIIVVDDGSTDDSPAVLETYAGKVKVLKQKNQGVGAARNAGVKASNGEFVAFLDADDVWLDEKIAAQASELIDGEQFGMVTCGVREFGVEGETLAEYTTGKSGWRSEDLLKHEAVVAGPGSSLMVRSSLFREIGGFDERKEMHPAEDWEFCYRVAEKMQLKFLPQVLVLYRNHGGNNHLKIPKMERALLLAYEKVFSNATAPEVLELKNFCYGKIHSILAGSYFHAGQYSDFLRHTIKSLRHSPANISRLANFPARLLRRRIAAKSSSGGQKAG